MRRKARAGYSMVELLTVLALIGILVALAAPSLRGMIRGQRVRSAMRQLEADIAYTRMAAVRSGWSAALRLRSASSCSASAPASVGADGYDVVVLAASERIVKTVSLREQSRSICLLSNRSAVQFNSRGLLSPVSNQTMWMRDDLLVDSLTISAVGRVLRR